MIVVDLGFLETPFQPGAESIRRIGGNLRAEQIERERIVQVELLLDGWQVDDAERSHLLDLGGILDAGRFHRFAGALDGAPDPGFADEHVVRLFGQHEAAGAR